MQTRNRAEELYRQSQEAVLRLVTEDNQHLPVPACPGWELRDIVAHLTGSLIDLITGNTRGAPGPAWTAGHVERFKARDLFEIRDLWLDAVEWESAELFEQRGLEALPDIVTHEFDVRGALDDTDCRDAERVHAACRVLALWVNRNWQGEGLPALEIITEADSIRIGEGEVRSTLRGTAFELSRVMTGRRSDAQIRALAWGGAPSPWLERLTLLGRRDTDLVE